MLRKKIFTLAWGSTRIYDTSIRSTELIHRLWWFIEMRWMAVGLCLIGYLITRLKLLPLNLEPDYFLLVSFFLFGINVFCTYIGRKLTLIADKTNDQQIRIFIIFQVIVDFFALSIISYACGTIETPILILFIGHIILVTLFFPRRLSLFFTLIGILFASLPLLLEWSGLIKTVSVFNSSFKPHILNNLSITLLIIFGIAACYGICWYLVSEISIGLLNREFQLEQAHNLLVNLDREKTHNTLRTTHELKAPLAAIKSYLYTLRDGYCGTLPEKAQRVVERMGERCDKLLKDISDIIRLNNLKNIITTPKDFKLINLKEIIIKEIEEVRAQADFRKIEIVHKDGEKDLLIRALPEHMQILVSNLLQNAIYYSPPEEKIEVITEKKNETINLHVIDRGIGIAKENLEKIFTEHFRTNEAVRMNPNGNGLGLSLVKEIVNLHGATIKVASEPGKGTHFTLTFKAER